MLDTTEVKMLQFRNLGDERGRLVVVEGGQDIPFEIKRVFYIYGSDPVVVRGKQQLPNSIKLHAPAHIYHYIYK